MNDRCMLPQRSARSEKRQRDRSAVVPNRRCSFRSVQTDVVIGQRFDPKAFWIGNLEQDVLWLDDLARHNFGRGDDAVGGGAQLLKAGAGLRTVSRRARSPSNSLSRSLT